MPRTHIIVSKFQRMVLTRTVARARTHLLADRMLLMTQRLRGRRRRLRRNDRVGEFRIVGWLGGGGNADVYRAASGDDRVALKVLRNRDGSSEPYRRFRQEVAQHKQLSDSAMRGVLPLLGFDVPEDPNDERPPWLAMPIAELLKVALRDEPSLEDVVSAVAEIAETLARLHAEGIAHRDVKPSNLYRYQGAWVLSDFGLVGVPGGEPLTVGAKALGPRHFLAPEMSLRPDAADSRQADVYSLGKTLWCLATGLATPPSGEHRRDLEWKRLGAWGVSHPRAFYLDSLMEQACIEVAEARPSMANMAEALAGWARASAASDGQEVIEMADIASEIADLLEGDSQRVERNRARRADVEAVATRFCAQIGTFIEQLDAAGLPHSGLTPEHQGVSAALQGFADQLLDHDRVACFRSIGIERNTGRDQRFAFLRSGVAAALAIDQAVVLGAAHTIRHAGGLETIWKGASDVVLLGSADLDREMKQLANGFLQTIPAALERYLQIIQGNPS